ncbi:MAG TPA: HPr family phosphocarrier protein [Euzebyales bacterium]|nr:HPr family phosphocarrier protein [Euzebyales bacterium]
MASIEVTIVDDVGLHARPAAKFVRLAKTFDATIVVRRGEREADAKSILRILTLEARRGDVIRIDAEGPDADEAVRRLHTLLTGGADDSG